MTGFSPTIKRNTSTPSGQDAKFSYEFVKFRKRC